MRGYIVTRGLEVPFITSGSRRTGRLLGGLVGLALLVAAPAAQASTDLTTLATAANPVRCVPEPALSKPFLLVDNDARDYTLVPGGNFESRVPRWLMGGGARIVDGNESFNVGGAEDRFSLSLPAASTAVSAPICIDETYPSFRFFARNTGDPSSTLKVDVLYLSTSGGLGVRASGKLSATSAWAATDALHIGLAIDPNSPTGAAPVAFRFTPQGSGGKWQIDDVYVDPMARG
jgi:hypothetical protein